MAHLVTLQYFGGMLYAPIPRRLARELGWTKRARIYVERDVDGAVVVKLLDDYLRDRRHRAARPAR